MKRIFKIIVFLCIGAIIGYLYGSYTARKDNKVVVIPITKEKRVSTIPSFANDSTWDAWMEEMIWNDLNEFGPV